jgi:hypothetical protein
LQDLESNFFELLPFGFGHKGEKAMSICLSMAFGVSLQSDDEAEVLEPNVDEDKEEDEDKDDGEEEDTESNNELGRSGRSFRKS